MGIKINQRGQIITYKRKFCWKNMINFLQPLSNLCEIMDSFTSSASKIKIKQFKNRTSLFSYTILVATHKHTACYK